MADCKFLPECMFFNDKLKKMPRLVKTMKKLYCLWNYKQCARYKIASTLSPKEIPENLLPSDTIKAKIIIAQNYRSAY
jgi:hypothetical protein